MTPTWCFSLGPESKTNVSYFLKAALFMQYTHQNVGILLPWVIAKKGIPKYCWALEKKVNTGRCLNFGQ